MFARGYRACDALLLLLLLACPILLYVSLVHRKLEPSWWEAGFGVLTLLAMLGLARVKIAFAFLAAPFLALAAYKFVNGMFFTDEWSLLRNPLFVARWAFEVVALLGVATYFWRKFAGRLVLNA